MKSRYIWAIGVGLSVGLIAGCEDKKQPPISTAPNPAPSTLAPTPPVYQEPPITPNEPTAAGPGPAAAPTAGDDYNPPADPTPIPPENKPTPRAGNRSARAADHKPAPRGGYSPAAPKGGETYTVKKGDTLQEISKKFYGTTTKWRKIYEANQKTIKGGPEKLMPGMKLTIPAK